MENAFGGVEVCLQDPVEWATENVYESESDLVDKRHALEGPDDHTAFHGMSHEVDIRPLYLVVLEEEFENESGNGKERWIAVYHVHFEAHEVVDLANGKRNEWEGRKVRPLQWNHRADPHPCATQPCERKKSRQTPKQPSLCFAQLF